MLTKTHKAISITLLAAALTACQSTSTTTSNNNSPDINEVAQQQYNGPKARIAVCQDKGFAQGGIQRKYDSGTRGSRYRDPDSFR